MKPMNKFLWWIISIILAVGIYGTGDLVFREFTAQNICPKLLLIPACYIILACFVTALIVHLSDKLHRVYFVATGIAFSIAVYASVTQLFGITECPKTGNDIPMCYISLGIFTTLIVAKLFLKLMQK